MRSWLYVFLPLLVYSGFAVSGSSGVTREVPSSQRPSNATIPAMAQTHPATAHAPERSFAQTPTKSRSTRAGRLADRVCALASVPH